MLERRSSGEMPAISPKVFPLAVDPSGESEIHEYETLPGDIYLLCSDGLSDMVSDEDIGMALQAVGANLNLAAQQLVQMANDNGGRDNVSVILIRILRKYPAGHGLASTIRTVVSGDPRARKAPGWSYATKRPCCLMAT